MPYLRNNLTARDDRMKAISLRAMSPNTGSMYEASGDDPGLIDLRMRAWQVLQPDKIAMQQRVTLRLGAMILAGIVCIVALGAGSAYLGLPGWMTVLAWMFLVFLFTGVQRRHALSSHSVLFINAFLREGRCPGCSYIIAGTPAASDGCIVCPECGAAWRGDRVGQPPTAPEPIRQYTRRLFQPTPLERLLSPVRVPLVVVDARGQAVHVIDPFLRRVDDPTFDRIGEQRAVRVTSQMRSMHRGRAAAQIPIVLMMIGGAVLMLTQPVRGTGFVDMLWGIGRIAVFAIVLWTGLGWLYSLLFGDRALNPDRASRILLNNLICPGCCEPLDEVSPDDKGVCACTVCHAAWEVPRHPGVDAAPI